MDTLGFEIQFGITMIAMAAIITTYWFLSNRD